MFKLAQTYPLILAALLAVLITACGNHVYHRVLKGDTLYSISWRYGQDYRQVATWNDLKPPYVLTQGQRLRVAPPLEQAQRPAPGAAPAVTASASANTTARPLPSKPATTSPRPPPKAVSAQQKSDLPPVRVASAPGAVNWTWPVRGILLNSYSATKPGQKGLDIGGSLGQPIYAAAAGHVVYAGDGLPKYGNLVIIKHNDSFLSAYAYNRNIHVKEQEDVARGQHIADMGSDGKGPPMLHFEIRLDGVSVDPLRYLSP